MKPKNHKKIVIGAGYGMGNLGDEAICETIINDIHSVDGSASITVLVFEKNLFLESHPDLIDNRRIRVLSMDFRRGTLRRPRKLFDLLLGIVAVIYCDIFIWGGGNLIRDRKYWLNIYIKPLLLAQALRKKIIIWSIGIDNISKPEVIKLANKIRKVDAFSVRDRASKDNFLNISRHFNTGEIDVIRDPVFHFSSLVKRVPAKDYCTIGFNITFWKADFSNEDKTEDFATSFAKILNSLHEKIKLRLVYLPSAPERDSLMYELLLKKMDPYINLEYPKISTPLQYVEHTSELDLFIGMRMHSIIMSSNVTRLPTLGIIYDEKVQALSEEEGLGDNFFSIEDVIEYPDKVERKIYDSIDDKLPAIDFNNVRQDSLKMIDVIKPIIFHKDTE
ncbi:MAG: polysaccharide pyruvyl transferase family protein [Candidatus Pacebacteria bacterium]|nr:polysaccharide pyruvyl transferase family protein [Candidatus Paceibacterota bacterium]